MKLLENRHFKIALLVSPVLAIISYVAVDHAVSEKPTAALGGRSYPLAQKGSCRYESGMCVLENGDVEILVRAERLSAQEVRLSVESELPISQAIVAAGRGESFSPPAELAVEGERRAVRLKVAEPDRDALRWAITIEGATYFAETPAVFVDHETPFSRENFSSRP